MLVLDRRPDESLILTDERTGESLGKITVLREASTGRTKLGITAPPHVRVERNEIACQKATEGQ